MKSYLSKYDFDWINVMHYFYYSVECRRSYKTMYEWLAVECRAKTDASMDAIEFNTEQDKAMFMLKFT